MILSPKKTAHIEFGRRAEEIASSYLQDRGMKVLTRNYRASGGEIDIVCKDGQAIVFVEVKARRSVNYGLPQEAVTLHKQRQIIRTAKCYLAEKRLFNNISVRFDVVAILLKSDQNSPNIQYIRDAFQVTD